MGIFEMSFDRYTKYGVIYLFEGAKICDSLMKLILWVVSKCRWIDYYRFLSNLCP